MVSKASIYSKTCVVCDWPALTLDDSGDPYCGGHTEMFTAMKDTSDGIDDAELFILLVDRPLMTGLE